jgi:hypothetical protein
MTRLSIFAALAAMLLAAGCGQPTTFKHGAQGAPYEIVVVADHDVWNGPVGDTLRAMFYQAVQKVSRPEPSFDVFRVLPEGFTQLVTRHRNVLFATVDPTKSEASINMERDEFSKPQILLNAVASDAAGLLELVNTNRDNIMLLLENAEKDRDVADARDHTPPGIATLIKEKFGFEMSMGPGYAIQKTENESDDFLWLAYRMPTADQGIVIYTYPFSGLKDFELENLLARRNEFVKRIPAENPGSHMATNPDPGFIEVTYKKIEGRQWAEMSGYWDAVGDFMGGPYRNYSTLDAANQRIIAIDFYVYSPDPRLMQRNFIRQLEHYLYTVSIPGQAPAWSEAGTPTADSQEAGSRSED